MTMWREQGPSGCPKSTGFSPIQPWFHVMQCRSVLDPVAFWYSREPPVIWAELLTPTEVGMGLQMTDLLPSFLKKS